MKIDTSLSGPALMNVINASQYNPASSAGFYESFFLRANHPAKPLAFWIRYTLFSPKASPGQREGQLWAIYFNGEGNRIHAAKEVIPFTECHFSNSGLSVKLGESNLDKQSVKGRVIGSADMLSWDLQYKGDSIPAFLLPLKLYSGGFPKAKALTGIPLADFTGIFHVNGERIDIDGWRGSQNHNWGVRHTDKYAWGQVAGFDNEPNAFLECATAKVKLGPIWSPWFTNVVLRIRDREIRLNSLMQAIRNKASYNFTSWSITAKQKQLKITITIEAPTEKFVRLTYDDPPGGTKICLNSKIASCKVVLEEKGKPPVELRTSSRAAFEILTTRDDI